MPLLKLQTSVALTDEQHQTLLTSLSQTVSQIIGKPEQYVMVTVESVPMMMSGQMQDAAFVELRSIGGIGGQVNQRLSEGLCEQLNTALGIDPARIYLNFMDISASDWGYNGSTFG